MHKIFQDQKGSAVGKKKVLEEGGISSVVSEDKFNNVPIQEFGVRDRFRLNVSEADFNRSANFLAKKLRETRLT